MRNTHLKTYLDLAEYTYSEEEYDYQLPLTRKLEVSVPEKIDQHIIDEIILWKINRYAQVDAALLELLNAIDPMATSLEDVPYTPVLKRLLKTKGIRLPVASTILRFRNPHIFQIIDQRAYRFVYGEELKISATISEKAIDKQIDFYTEYLQKLRSVASAIGWRFEDLDRVLYIRDKQYNDSLKIKT